MIITSSFLGEARGFATGRTGDGLFSAALFGEVLFMVGFEFVFTKLWVRLSDILSVVVYLSVSTVLLGPVTGVFSARFFGADSRALTSRYLTGSALFVLLF